MDLHIYIDHSDLTDTCLEDIAEAVLESISTWVGKKKQGTQVLNLKPEDDLDSWKLGLSVQVKSKFKLKDPLNFLYTLAKEHKCEFVIATFNTHSGESEEVCYFGFEEGRPDLFEIANYLEL